MKAAIFIVGLLAIGLLVGACAKQQPIVTGTADAGQQLESSFDQGFQDSAGFATDSAANDINPSDLDIS